MPNVYEGDRTAGDGRFAIVVSRYNDSITGKLLDGAVATLTGAGVAERSIDVAWVPGAWEIPLVARRFAAAGDYSAVLCLGAVIKGETTHDQHINRQVSLSLGRIGLDTGVPVLFGVLTCNSIEQAIHRSGGNVGNKGVECAEAALEMASLLRKLPAAPPGDQRPFEVAERRQAAAPETLGTNPPLTAEAAGQEPPALAPPALEQPAIEQPAIEQPAIEQPAIEQPAVEPRGAEVSVAGPPDAGPPDAEPPVRERAQRKRTSRKTRRSRARQVVLQVLYEDDLNPQHNLHTSDSFLQRRLRFDSELVAFARELVAGVRRNRAQVDRILTDKLQNWSLSRLAATDRNVLRLGIYEIVFAGTPGPVAINEAVELARRFGSQDSAKFVNGLLDRVLRDPTRGK